MNEELKIIIKAVTADAKKSLGEVKKALSEVGEEGEKASGKLKISMAAIGKATAAVVTGIVAITGALVALGNRSKEFTKEFNRVVSSFQGAGSTAAQATKTYKDLYRFLGDTAQAAEASSILAQLTTNEKDLAEWTTVLQGVYAKWNASIPVESLAEAANETAKTGTVVGGLADALNWLGVSEDAVNAKLQTLNTTAEREAYLRQLLLGLYGNSAALYEKNNQALNRYNEAQFNLQVALSKATRYVTPLMTSLANLATNLLTVLTPAISTVAVYLTAFIELIAEAIQWVGSFFGMFSSGSEGAKADVEGYQAAMRSYMNSLSSSSASTSGALDKQSNKLKEIKKQMMGFDELNVVSNPATAADVGAAGVPGIGSGIQAPNPADFGLGSDLFNMDDFKKDMEEAKEHIKGLGVLIGITAAAFGAWKLAGFLTSLKTAYDIIKNTKDVFPPELVDEYNGKLETLKSKLYSFVGIAMIIAGAFLLIKGYADAWANGIDWGNLATILAGIGLIVGGLAIALGPMAAAWGLVAGSIALVVLGIKDFVENGYSMEAVIAIAIGVIGTLIGVVWALNSALLANPITWVIAGIIALVATFVILWNECEGFRNFWINLWEKVKNAASTAGTWLKNFFTKTIPGFFNTVINFVKKNWQGLLLLLANPFAGAYKLIYDNCEGFRKVVDNVTAKVKDAFARLWTNIKSIFSGVGSFFKDTFGRIADIFRNIGTVVADAISGAVRGAINSVLSGAVNIINGFIHAINFAIGIINAIPGVSISSLSTLSVPRLARGGIVNKSILANIGEGGYREAVLPLDRNTEWMDVLANKINGNGPSKIVLMLDGKELGWANIRSINSITKQTGSLQLTLA